MKKIKRSIYIAIFVSLAAQINFTLITEGFIIALSVLVMAIFVYCYEDLSPKYVAFCSGIFSPLFRIIILLVRGGAVGHTAYLVIPDAIFFFSYGIIYTLVYKYIVRAPKNIRNFPMVIFVCDFLSNVMELLARSILLEENLFTIEIISYLAIIALFRTTLIQLILLAMETYSNLLVKKEHDEEYKKLINQASILESELHVIEKNSAEIEEIMKKAYFLYKKMGEMNLPKELRALSLDISKSAHDVKGDYRNVVSILKETVVDQYNQQGITIEDIVAIEKTNFQNIINQRNLNVEISVKIKDDFYVRQYFKMMSIIRNLMLNGIEAMGEKGGKLTISVKNSGEDYIIKVKDTGCGIEAEDMETIFFEGYSSKFDNETGDIQRGIGLSLVREFVEDYFHGEISVESEVGVYTCFIVKIPMSTFMEDANAVLHN